MIINFLHKLSSFNDWLFHGLDGIIESFGFPEWITDALIDSFHILPFYLLCLSLLNYSNIIMQIRLTIL